MDMHGVVSGASNTAATGKQLEGSVLEVLRELLAGRRDAAVLALFTKLVARNEELELLLAKMRDSKNRGEHISSAQLDLFLDKLREQSEGQLQEANERLEQIAAEHAGRPDRPGPPKQPPVRRPPPPGLRRIHNPIRVPDEERPCPTCGKERRCIHTETTEIIDLIPAEVVVRLDEREILACMDCDAELVRAPLGDKVVAGGAYGSRLVAELVVGKYWDGLPLNRQGDQLARLGLSMPSSSMADQITWATDLLRPLWHHLLAAVLRAVVMHVDGTSLPVRDRDSAKGIVTGALWGYVGDADKAAYLYTSTSKAHGQRANELGPAEYLARRSGPIVADASNLFDETFQSPERVEVGCNMQYPECAVINDVIAIAA
jgi:transposase